LTNNDALNLALKGAGQRDGFIKLLTRHCSSSYPPVTCPVTGSRHAQGMMQTHSKVVSLAAFRATRREAGTGTATAPVPPGRTRPSMPKNVEHRRRMLGFLRTLRPLLR
jgi:hypothetical protein